MIQFPREVMEENEVNGSTRNYSQQDVTSKENELGLKQGIDRSVCTCNTPNGGAAGGFMGRVASTSLS